MNMKFAISTRRARPKRRTSARGAFLIVGALLGSAAGPYLGEAFAAAPAEIDTQTAERLTLMAQAADRGDCPAALKEARSLIDEGFTSALPERAQALAYDIAASCELQAQRMEQAYAHAIAGTRLEAASDYLWRYRLAFEIDTKRADFAVETVEEMSQARGAALNSTPVRWMWSLHRMLKDGGREELRRRLLKILSSNAYAPDNNYEPVYAFQLEYAKMLQAAGDEAGAQALLVGIAEPTAVMRASLDPDLRPLMPAADPRSAAERMLALYKEAAARHPDHLIPVNRVASYLRLLGRSQEAIDWLNSFANRVEKEGEFTDSGEELIWWWDELGRNYAALGDYENSAQAFRRGAALEEEGALNVSQVINLAAMQNAFGRGHEALKTMAAFDDPKRSASPFGNAQVRVARGCARSLVGDRGGAGSDLQYLETNRKDAPIALVELLLCLGDMDGAAREIGRQLRDPDQRVGALLFLSDFDEPPHELASNRIARNLDLLKKRADVEQAAKAAGGTRRFHIQRE